MKYCVERITQTQREKEEEKHHTAMPRVSRVLINTYFFALLILE